jgi:serine/threonine-protein kinase
LVHRDVKPGNILVTPDGRVLLTDFGIAKGVAGTADDDLTSPNVMMGTAKYLSPEQVRGKKLDGRADLYSLGLVLYECLAGRVPFLGETDTDTALARLNRDPTDLHRLRPTLPAGLAELIHKLLARKPDQRYATGAEVRAELQRIASAPRHEYDDTTLAIAAGATPPGGLRGRMSRTSPVQPGGSLARGTGSLTVTGSTTNTASARVGAPTGPRASTGVGGGSVTDHRGGRPMGTITRLEPARDTTPRSPRRPSASPNRANDPRRRAHMLIVLALGAAAAVGGLLWITRTSGSGGAPAASTPPSNTSATAPAGSDSPSDGNSGANGGGAPERPVGANGLAGVTVFDPDGDGKEMNQLAANVLDGNPATVWTTVCYASRYMGGKQGVGLVADLGHSTSGTLSVGVASAPFQVRVFTSDAAEAPTTFAGWGPAVRAVAGTAAHTLTVKVEQPARWVLVAFVELGRSGTCSSMPYRGAFSDFNFR